MRNDVTIYVGIDFSKEKFNACLLMDQGVMGESEFPNTKTGYLKLTKWGRTRQTLWSAVQMLTQKLCCQTIHDCPKVVPLHYESE